MTSETVYTWETDDPSLTFVSEAINRLISFVQSPAALHSRKRDKQEPDSIYVKAYHRVLDEKRFTYDELCTLCKFLRVLGKRAEQNYAEKDSEIATSILQAAANATAASDQLYEIFRNNEPL